MMKAKHLVIAMVVLSCLISRAWAEGGNGGGSNAVLTDTEAEHLIFLREEEKLARDVYLSLAAKYGTTIFVNISASEQKHMDSVKGLIEKYDLVDPVTDNTPGAFTNPDIAAIYNELIARGEQSLIQALKVGVDIEIMDIHDIKDIMLPDVTKSDVERVLQNLLAGSYNHLDEFTRSLEQEHLQ